MQRHNDQVVKEIIQTLFDFQMADHLKFIGNPKYGYANMQMLFDATNIARVQLMGMKPIKVYNLEEED